MRCWTVTHVVIRFEIEDTVVVVIFLCIIVLSLLGIPSPILQLLLKHDVKHIFHLESVWQEFPQFSPHPR